MADLEKLVDELSNLTVMEAAELSKLLEDKWGVSAATPVAIAAVGGDAGGDAGGAVPVVGNRGAYAFLVEGALQLLHLVVFLGAQIQHLQSLRIFT